MGEIWPVKRVRAALDGPVSINSKAQPRYHATVNLGDTVAVASQRIHQSAADMLHREVR